MKKFLSAAFGAMLLTNTAFAMTFSEPVEIGKIGFPVQAPFRGFIVAGETFNSGEPYLEDEQFSINGHRITTYVKGIAQFGDEADALYCAYDFNDDTATAIKFGGGNNYVLTRSGSYKDILKINTDSGLTLYAIYHEYCTSHLSIIGRQADGKWVNYIDSKKISEVYFGGNDGYKMENSVIYEKPISDGDTIILKYRRWNWENKSKPEGEIRLKWDDAAQWFSIAQIIYDKKN